MAWFVARYLAGASLLLTAICGCGGSLTTLPAVPGEAGSEAAILAAHQSKYIYVADRTREKLIVYPAFVASPKPIRELGSADGIVEIGGVATDRDGNVYVANGEGANVLEFSSGAKSLLKKYTRALNHPVNVALDRIGNLFVADQDDHYPYGVTSSIVEYYKGSTRVKFVTLDPSQTNEPFHGVAIDSSGHPWASVSQSGDVWPPPIANCAVAPDHAIFEFISPTLIRLFPLRNNVQVWGVAIRGSVLYGADICSSVQTYDILYGNHLGPVPYSHDVPMYVTVSDDHLIAVPCAGSGKNGYVYVQPDLGASVTIRSGLRGPIGAAAGP